MPDLATAIPAGGAVTATMAVDSPRKRVGQSLWPVRVAADASKVVWAIDFQLDSTIDGKAINRC
jgi:hypothetical protein